MTVSEPGVEVLPDWTPSADSGLARFDIVVKVAAGATLPAGSALHLRLLCDRSDPRVLVSRADLGALAGPAWRHVRGRLVDVEADVAAVDAVVDGSVSVPALRRDATVPVMLRAFRDIIRTADEPLLWWRYFNATGEPVDVRSLRNRTALLVDGRRIRLPGTYNGPAALPPGRAMSGLWSAADLSDLHPGTHRMQLVVGDHASHPFAAHLG